ncbi:MAG: FAD:protein FMN transferase [Clostridia bacterium]|nr:FAD:protein FMN transferase [Clostridia bacterium]
MKIKLKMFCLNLCAVLVAFTFSFGACNTGEQKHFTAFHGTAVTVQSRNKLLSDDTAEKISALLSDLNSEFSATLSGSTVFKINAAAAGEKTEISERFKSVALSCGEMRGFTDGKFDPSVYPLTLLWQFAPNFSVPDFAVPTDEDITATKALVGYDKFSFSDGATKTTDGAKLDFGGALKGYAADKIAEIMKEDGVTKGYVSIGGSSIYVISTDTLSVLHPRENGNILKIKMKEKNLSVSTSGDYQKTYTQNGKTYSHIINPFTGYPQNTGVASATVIGNDGLKLDALTTAICLYEHDFDLPENGELYKFIRKILSAEDFKNAQIFAVCVNGERKQILTNKKQDDDFTLLDKDYTVINVN